MIKTNGNRPTMRQDLALNISHSVKPCSRSFSAMTAIVADRVKAKITIHATNAKNP